MIRNIAAQDPVASRHLHQLLIGALVMKMGNAQALALKRRHVSGLVEKWQQQTRVAQRRRWIQLQVRHRKRAPNTQNFSHFPALLMQSAGLPNTARPEDHWAFRRCLWPEALRIERNDMVVQSTPHQSNRRGSDFCRIEKIPEEKDGQKISKILDLFPLQPIIYPRISHPAPSSPSIIITL